MNGCIADEKQQKLAAYQADDITLFVVWGRSLEKRRWTLEKEVVSYHGVKKRAKSP